MTVAVSEVEKVSQEITRFCGGIPAKIESQEAYIHGSNQVVEINRELKKWKTWFAEFLLPAKTAKDSAAKSLKAQETIRDKALYPLALADQQLRNALLDWKRVEAKRARDEQERQSKLFAKRVASAEAKGKDPSKVKPPMVLPQPKATKATVGGGFGIVSRKRLVIVDESKIPEQFFDRIRNDKRIQSVLRQGLEVPGATLTEELTSMVRTV